MENNKTKVIILAAGEGKRLHPLTLDNPKCLTEIFGKKLLEWQLDVFRKLDINDVSVVRGFQAEKINFPNLNYYSNDNFHSTNMLETLFCAREKLQGSVIVVYGDIIFEKKVLQKLLESKHDLSGIVDKKWENYWKVRFPNPLDDAESLIVDENDFITDIGQKTTNLDHIQGQFIGLMKFQNDGLKFLIECYDKLKHIAKDSKNLLNSKLTFEKSYMTDFLQFLIGDGARLKAIYIDNGWLELDSIEDYKIYQTLQKTGTLSNFFKLPNSFLGK